MKTGQIIAGRFVLEQRLGIGGMGEVFRAQDQTTGEPVAVKILTPGNEDSAGRFFREAELIAGLDHPGIVKHVADGFVSARRPFLAMEWLDGYDLARRLKKGKLPIDDCMTMLRNIAEALTYAHEAGVVHRDIKPGNLFLVQGKVDDVRLIDFGIGLAVAERVAAPRLTSPGVMVGTPGYMAPEQVRGMDTISPAADVFAVGCVLFECLTGRRAFAGIDPVATCAKIIFDEPRPVSDIRPEVPPAIERLVQRLLFKDPSERPSDGSELIAEIDALDHDTGSAVVRSSISGGEQRIVSILMASDPSLELFDSEAATMPNSLIQARDSELWRTIRELGGHLERLSDGSLVAQMHGKGAATDAAGRAARLALILRARLPNMVTVLATGTAQAGGQVPVGEIIDRAADLMRNERDRTVESNRRSSAIRVDALTAGLLDTRFEIAGDEYGLILRGQREPMVVERTLLGARTPFVGRARELGHLIATWEECIEESVARAVVVAAPAGLGKSRLCAEFLRLLPERNRTQLFVSRGEMVGAGSAYALLAQGLRRMFGICDGEPLEIRRAKLRGKLVPNFATEELEQVTTFLGELIGTRYSDDPSVQLAAALDDARLMADQMHLAWKTWIDRQCRKGPILILLDDLHWGDAATVRAIDATLRQERDSSIMVLALARPEVHERFPGLWSKRDAEYLNLARLPQRAGERLVRAVLANNAEGATISRLVAQAEGNAFFLEELIRAAAEGNFEAPETVLAMIQARLSRLPAESRRILRAASVFGRRFWVNGVAKLLDVGGRIERLRERIEELAEAEFIQRSALCRFAGQEQYAFHHALVRDATYSTLTDQDRELGHRLAGQWLEECGETDAAVLAEHFEKGKDLAHATAWYVRATQQALESDSIDDVHERAERGVLCGATNAALGELRLAQVEALIWQGSLDSALSKAIEAVPLFESHSDLWYRAVSSLAIVCTRLGLREPAVPLTDALLSYRPNLITSAYAKALVTMGRALLELGELERLDELRQVLRRARQKSERTFRPWGRLLCEVEPEESTDAEIAAWTNTLAAWRQAGDRRRACIEAINLAYLWVTIGVYGRALPLLRQSLEDARNLASPHLVAHAQTNLGCCLAKMGEFDDALEAESQAVEGHHQLGFRHLEAAARIDLAYILGKKGELERAENEAREASEQTRAMPRTRVRALATLAMILLDRGQVAEALEAVQTSVRISDEYDNNVEDGEALARLIYAEALRASEQPGAATEAIALARERVLSRAGSIDNREWKRCFLYNVPEHARTLELAREWTGQGTDELFRVSGSHVR